MSAAGILEARGMVSLIAAGDAMLKSAEVEIDGRHGVGAGWVSLVISGDVAAVQTALPIGERVASESGDVIMTDVIARPEERTLNAMPHNAAMGGTASDDDHDNRALGIVETQGLTPLVAGADAMVKRANVETAGWAVIGGALAHLVVRGEVEDVRTAVAAGRTAAATVGQVNASTVIPQPSPGLAALLPKPGAGKGSSLGAMGLLETTGYVGAVAGADAMTKSGDLKIGRFAVGSGGRVAVISSGSLDDVQAALHAGSEAAERVGELNCAEMISRPDEAIAAEFAAPQLEHTVEDGGEAMGLIETRSTIALVMAVDQMLKSAKVRFEGTFKVGYFLTATAIRGDVGAVRTALDMGATTAAKYGELAAVDLISYPMAEFQLRLPHLDG